MNTNLGLIGKKLGNTQLFAEDGTVTRVTAIQVGPCRVIGKRTVQRDGYSALIVGFGNRPEKRLTKAEAGFFKANNVEPTEKMLEFRLPESVVESYEAGAVLKPSEIFQEGQLVDVSGKSKGRGYAGVMKRWNFSGAGTDTHGTHEYRRHGGSIGANMTPGRTLPNIKMAGQYGNERVTMMKLKVAKIMDDEQVVMVKGAVPGPKNSFVTLRQSAKSKNIPVS